MTFTFGKFQLTITANQMKALAGLVTAIIAALQAFGILHVLP